MKHFYLTALLLLISLVQKAQVTMVTNIPPVVAPNVVLKVEAKINKGSISNFSKYEMELPQGFEATEVNSKTGFFTFEKNIAKIVWVSLPNDQEFIVSFTLKTPAATGPYILTQKFYYIENGAKKEIVGQQIDLKIDAAGVTKTLSYLPDEPEASAITNTVAATTTSLAVTTSLSSLPTNTVTTIVMPVNPVITPTVVAVGNTIASTSSNTLSATPGLTFLVQIGTFSAVPDKSRFSNLGKVTVEKDGALYKVLIGEYPTKEEALKKREELIPKGYNGFLVKYQNGQRVK